MNKLYNRKEKGKLTIQKQAPGFTKTSFGGFVKGGKDGDAKGTYLEKAGSVQDASKEAVKFATAGIDGVNGTYSSKEGVLPW